MAKVRIRYKRDHGKALMTLPAMRQLVTDELQGVADRAGEGHYEVKVDLNQDGDRYRGVVIAVDREARRNTADGALLNALGGGV